MTLLDARFFATTRGQVLLALRRGPRTVDDLAQTLGLTRNTVRGHLVSLERDELVRLGGHRRGFRKPARLYELAQGAEQILSQAYGPVLRQLLNVLSAQLSADALNKLMREVAQRVAADEALIPTGREPRERLRRARALLEQLGGPALVEEADDVRPRRPPSANLTCHFER
jgi:predicted ArsR family transcriptional regulator